MTVGYIYSKDSSVSCIAVVMLPGTHPTPAYFFFSLSLRTTAVPRPSIHHSTCLPPPLKSKSDPSPSDAPLHPVPGPTCVIQIAISIPPSYSIRPSRSKTLSGIYSEREREFDSDNLQCKKKKKRFESGGIIGGQNKETDTDNTKVTKEKPAENIYMYIARKKVVVLSKEVIAAGWLAGRSIKNA